MAVSPVGLQLLQLVSVRGSLSAAASDLGFTQSAASRQLASLERSAGRRLVDRGPHGAVLTEAGIALLPHAAAVLEALDAADKAARGEVVAPVVRLGVFMSAGAALLPLALTSLSSRQPSAQVRTTEATSPALLRGVQSGRLDAALIVSRPPFGPLTSAGQRLREEVVGTMNLQIAVSIRHPIAKQSAVRLADLADVGWIGSVHAHGDPTLGVWPGLPGRPELRHQTGDWMAKLQLVAAGLGVTTVPPILATVLPPAVVMVPVADPPTEQRRITLIYSPGAVRRGPQLRQALRDAFDALVEASG